MTDPWGDPIATKRPRRPKPGAIITAIVLTVVLIVGCGWAAIWYVRADRPTEPAAHQRQPARTDEPAEQQAPPRPPAGPPIPATLAVTAPEKVIRELSYVRPDTDKLETLTNVPSPWKATVYAKPGGPAVQVHAVSADGSLATCAITANKILQMRTTDAKPRCSWAPDARQGKPPHRTAVTLTVTSPSARLDQLRFVDPTSGKSESLTDVALPWTRTFTVKNGDHRVTLIPVAPAGGKATCEIRIPGRTQDKQTGSRPKCLSEDW